MRKAILAGLTATALTGASLVPAGAAQAADDTLLHVQTSAPTCTDAGTGTLEQPFCTINAAAAVVAPGQTVEISAGIYREHVTVTRSGTPDAPIVFRAKTGAQVYGPGAGILVDGQHDVRIEQVRVVGASQHPALDIRDSRRITVSKGSYALTDGATGTIVRLTGVTDSVLDDPVVFGGLPDTGVLLDAATSGVRLSSLSVLGAPTETGGSSVGIRVEGPDNTVVGNDVSYYTGAAVSIAAGVRGTTVVNNEIGLGLGYGVHNAGAAGTAITNNTFRDRCRASIRVDGASTGVSVQNNHVIQSRDYGCAGGPGARISVADGATADTVVDYNLVDLYRSGSASIYEWNGTLMGLATFRGATGRGAHDLDTPDPTAPRDSANSAAPGYPTTDRYGTARVDDPLVSNTGAGPVTWADRGTIETVRGPESRFAITPDLDAGTVTVDASTSVPGVSSIASYQFDFGDGTSVTQDTPTATHRYATRATYAVSVQVTGADGRKDERAQQVSVLARTGTVGLLALSSLRYVSPGTGPASWPSLAANRPDLGPTAQFDLADAGDGKVALFVRAAGRYLTADTTGVAALTYQTALVGDAERFTLTRNTDGTVSLRSVVGGRYVTATTDPTYPLIASGKSIGAGQKFYQVDAAQAGRTLKAGANGRFVSAESAGTKPLIANRTSAGPWERFDLLDLGSGKVAILAQANGKVVSADGTGTKPLIANRTSAGAWETFVLVRNADGTIGLKATINNRYVSAESAGAKPLIANRTTIGAWERFTLGG
ncbi:PKD domain-containing protein [Micromonospora maritima]|uniref:PKD domain-containing protein n=1 Tax=Micromonospora maritima TaxID=986711 RepID=A0ABW7ZFT0_9ACTN